MQNFLKWLTSEVLEMDGDTLIAEMSSKGETGCGCIYSAMTLKEECSGIWCQKGCVNMKMISHSPHTQGQACQRTRTYNWIHWTMLLWFVCFTLGVLCRSKLYKLWSKSVYWHMFISWKIAANGMWSPTKNLSNRMINTWKIFFMVSSYVIGNYPNQNSYYFVHSDLLKGVDQRKNRDIDFVNNVQSRTVISKTNQTEIISLLHLLYSKSNTHIGNAVHGLSVLIQKAVIPFVVKVCRRLNMKYRWISCCYRWSSWLGRWICSHCRWVTTHYRWRGLPYRCPPTSHPPAWACLFLACVLSPMVSANHETIGCYWRSSISTTMPFRQEVQPRTACAEGALYWYYPKGELLTIFKSEISGSNFKLCLQTKSETPLYGVYNQTATSGGETKTKIHLSTTGQETCIISHKGQMNVLIEAPTIRYYVVIIKYSMTT